MERALPQLPPLAAEATGAVAMPSKEPSGSTRTARPGCPVVRFAISTPATSARSMRGSSLITAAGSASAWKRPPESVAIFA